MSRIDVAIVDNGGANTASLRFALARLGHDATITADAQRIESATHVILPGVGSAQDAMARLRASGLDRLLPRLSQPVLGICLGMQLLFERSEEGDTDCLGALAGTAQRLTPAPGRPVPHMGWNTLDTAADSALLAGVPPRAYAYFVHSYAVPPGPETVARTDYGTPFSAVVSRGNFHGTQFHPERSGPVGARILDNFLRLQGCS